MEPRTAAGRTLFTDMDPMDMLESNGVTPDDIAKVEAEARAPFRDSQDRWRLVRVQPDVLSKWGTRTEDGDRLTVAWGEPDDDGIYDPTFTRHSDENLRAEATQEALRAARAAVEGLPGRLRYDGEGAYVQRDAALAAIDALGEDADKP